MPGMHKEGEMKEEFKSIKKIRLLKRVPEPYFVRHPIQVEVYPSHNNRFMAICQPIGISNTGRTIEEALKNMGISIIERKAMMECNPFFLNTKTGQRILGFINQHIEESKNVKVSKPFPK